VLKKARNPTRSSRTRPATRERSGKERPKRSFDTSTTPAGRITPVSQPCLAWSMWHKRATGQRQEFLKQSIPSLARELCSWTEAIASWAGIPSIADDKKAALYEPEAAEFIKLAWEESQVVIIFAATAASSLALLQGPRALTSTETRRVWFCPHTRTPLMGLTSP